MGFLKNPCFFVIIEYLDKLQFIFRKDIFIMPIYPNDDIPMPEGFQPYAIIEEKYIKSMVLPNLEDGSLVQTPSRYVEILLSNSMGYEFLPTDVATGSLAYILNEGALLFFNGEYWEDVGGGGSGSGGGGEE